MVYRGLGGVNLPACFEECEEGGGRGGSDFGFLSTTTKKEVAVDYIGDKEMPVLFRIEVGDMDRGASISFLSQVFVCVHGMFDVVPLHVSALCVDWRKETFLWLLTRPVRRRVFSRDAWE